MYTLDLLHTRYSEEDLNRLTMEKEGMEGKWLGGVKNWMQRSGCFQAAQMMEQTAEAALSGSAKVAELKVLKENLEVHDRIIKTFNSRFFLVSCPNHQVMESRLQDRIDELQREQFLQRITREVESGMPIDRDNLPSIMKKANFLFKGKIPQEVERLLAAGYIQTLSDNIHSGKVHIPEGFQFLGELPPDKIEEGKRQFLAWLQVKLDQEIAHPTPTPVLVTVIQDHFIERVVATLSSGSPSLHLKEILKAIHQFELKVNREVRRAQGDVCELTQSTYEATKDSLTPMHKQAYELYINTPTLIKPFPITELYRAAFASLPPHWQEAIDAPQLLEKALESKLPDKTAFFDHYSSQMMEAIAAISQIKWFDVYGKYRLFAFDQSMYGLGAMLGEGTCLAITYRWNKLLQKDPTQPLRSADDLRESEFAHDTTEGISRRDRLIQAMHLVERFRYTYVTQGILKQDGLSEYPLFERSISKPFREVLGDLLKTEHRGVFMLNATDEQREGHAMGLQIDPVRNIYRFYDVNTGMYQFPSLEVLKEAAPSYIEELYPYFNRFNLVQHR